MIPIAKSNKDILTTLGVLVGGWIAFVASDGIARGSFVFAGVLQPFAMMTVCLPAFASLARRRWTFTWFHLFPACYVAAYVVFILVRGWSFGWVLTAEGAAIALVLFSVLTVSRWLGWLNE